MSREQAKAAIQQARTELSSYYHPACQTTTEINDHVIVIAALDPWFFPTTHTDCAGCGSAPMTDVVLADKRSVYEAFSSLRKSVPMSGKLMRFLGIPLAFAIIGMCLSPFFPTKAQAPNRLQIAIFCGAAGFLLGCFAIRYVFKELRRLGLFWKS